MPRLGWGLFDHQRRRVPSPGEYSVPRRGKKFHYGRNVGHHRPAIELAESHGQGREGDWQAKQEKDKAELENIYATIDKLEKTEIRSKEYMRYTELFPWFLFAGLLFLGLEVILANTRFRKIP